MSKPIRASRRPRRNVAAPKRKRDEIPRSDETRRDAERRYRSFFENAVEGLYQTTPGGRFLDANPALARICGYDEPDELIADCIDIGSQIYADPGRRDEFVRAIEEQGFVRGFESQLRRRDGSVIWICEHGRAVRDSSGRILCFEGAVEDVTPRKQAEEALRDSEARYALAARAASDGLWDWNLVSGDVYFSPRWKAMIGYAEDEFGDDVEAWLQRVHPDEAPRLKAELEGHLQGQSSHFESEFRIRHRDGSFLWVLSRGLAVFDEAGRALRMAGSQTDITKRKAAEERLFHDAFHDSLTGLPNRELLIDRLGRLLWRARRREGYAFAVAYFDLDRLKVINDSLGHLAGDRLLLAVARRIEESMRGGDSAARIGGDEFAVLIDDLEEPADALRVVGRLQQAIHSPLVVNGEELYTTASIGIAFYNDRYDRAEDMLRDADIAMYAAKEAGGARYQVFDHGMHERAVARMQIEGALRRAVDRSELRALYQPIICLKTGRLAGFEALIRWQHPERGVISPVDFIPIAEETGLIHGIGRWVLHEACAQMARWRRALRPEDPISMSVNLSGRQLADPELVSRAIGILEETHLPPELLRLEITESAVMQDAETARQRLSELRALGVGLSIDDFGTGYSSLSYLHRLPLTALKIDKAFVWAMRENSREAQICQGIVTLAQTLGLTVIAEGIETEEQRGRLGDMGCEYAQGYLFARPLEAEAAEELMRSGRIW